MSTNEHMYKLLIVEDELNDQQAILGEDGWNKLGFTLIGIAENGIEALEMVEDVLPDVVITDIQMPHMNGLALIEQLRSRFGMIKIIILTGYNEFDYAQRAVKYQVDEFLLKPVQEHALVEVMNRIRSELDRENESKKNIELLRDHYRTSLPVLRTRAIENLIRGKLSARDFEKSLEKFDLRLLGERYLVSVISFENSIDTSAFGTKREESAELFLFALHNIVKEIVEKREFGETIEFERNIVILSAFSIKDTTEIRALCNRVLEEIVLSVRKYLDVPATASVGTIIEGTDRISLSYEDALLALDYKLLLGGERILYIDDLELRSQRRIYFSDEDQHALSKCIKLGDREQTASLISGFFNKLTGENVAWFDCQIYVMNMMTALLRTCQVFDIDFALLWGKDWDRLINIRAYDSLEQLRTTFSSCCTRLMESIHSTRTLQCIGFAQQAASYIKEHHAQADLNIEKVAAVLHISPGYLSNIIKRELHTTFCNYLMEVRMEKAKEMLRGSDRMIYEISELLGFEEQAYFSYCFKKYTGFSPRQYRKGE